MTTAERTSTARTRDLRSAQRYALMIEQLGDELGRREGWLREVAAMLGVHLSSLHRLRNGTRTAGHRVIERAVTRLGISPAFFYASFRRPPRFRDFVRGSAETTVMVGLEALDGGARKRVVGWALERWPELRGGLAA